MNRSSWSANSARNSSLAARPSPARQMQRVASLGPLHGSHSQVENAAPVLAKNSFSSAAHDTKTDADRKIADITNRFSDILNSFDEQMETIGIRELKSWFATSLDYCGDMETIDQLKQLQSEAKLLQGKIAFEDVDHLSGPQTTSLNDGRSAITHYDHEMDSKKRALNISSLKWSEKKLVDLRAEVSRLQKEQTQLREANALLMKAIPQEEADIEQLRFERLISVEIPLQLQVDRRGKNQFSFVFHNLSNVSKRKFTVVVNRSNGQCTTDPYCKAVEHYWFSNFQQTRDEPDWRSLIIMTHHILQHELNSRNAQRQESRKRSAGGAGPGALPGTNGRGVQSISNLGDGTVVPGTIGILPSRKRLCSDTNRINGSSTTQKGGQVASLPETCPDEGGGFMSTIWNNGWFVRK